MSLHPADRVDAVRKALRESGLDINNASPHSWRCGHPDRYPGYCTCVEDTADTILDALAELDPLYPPQPPRPEKTADGETIYWGDDRFAVTVATIYGAYTQVVHASSLRDALMQAVGIPFVQWVGEDAIIVTGKAGGPGRADQDRPASASPEKSTDTPDDSTANPE